LKTDKPLSLNDKKFPGKAQKFSGKAVFAGFNRVTDS
jgi:hypothetical protein